MGRRRHQRTRLLCVCFPPARSLIVADHAGAFLRKNSLKPSAPFPRPSSWLVPYKGPFFPLGGLCMDQTLAGEAPWAGDGEAAPSCSRLHPDAQSGHGHPLQPRFLKNQESSKV